MNPYRETRPALPESPRPPAPGTIRRTEGKRVDWTLDLNDLQGERAFPVGAVKMHFRPEETTGDFIIRFTGSRIFQIRIDQREIARCRFEWDARNVVIEAIRQACAPWPLLCDLESNLLNRRWFLRA